MQTIETTYHGPSCLRGARVTARSSSGIKLTVSWDHGLNTEANHQSAAQLLKAKLGWAGDMVGGSRNSGGMVWVFVDDSLRLT